MVFLSKLCRFGMFFVGWIRIRFFLEGRIRIRNPVKYTQGMYRIRHLHSTVWYIYLFYYWQEIGRNIWGTRGSRKKVLFLVAWQLRGRGWVKAWPLRKKNFFSKLEVLVAMLTKKKVFIAASLR